ncbi:MAG: hypothetical protein PUK75_08840 [bacterium]|nr:hypothetical protein [bacterium]MDY4100181.1 hypothetical protein [Lachnospiraceae bacterium]
MSIFFWFLIIAVITLALNMTMILQMKKRNNIRILPIGITLLAGYLSAALLYLCALMHGTQVLEQTQAASFQIETESYQTTGDGTRTAFAFCSKEGIPFQFSDTDLLSSEFPEAPTTVNVYYCKTRTGFSACYLSEGSGVYYLLR